MEFDLKICLISPLFILAVFIQAAPLDHPTPLPALKGQMNGKIRMMKSAQGMKKMKSLFASTTGGKSLMTLN